MAQRRGKSFFDINLTRSLPWVFECSLTYRLLASNRGTLFSVPSLQLLLGSSVILVLILTCIVSVKTALPQTFTGACSMKCAPLTTTGTGLY